MVGRERVCFPSSSLPPKFLSEAGRLTKKFPKCPYYQQLQLQQESSPERTSKRIVNTAERAGATTENCTVFEKLGSAIFGDLGVLGAPKHLKRCFKGALRHVHPMEPKCQRLPWSRQKREELECSNLPWGAEKQPSLSSTPEKTGHRDPE